jgi:hypothetical protein
MRTRRGDRLLLDYDEWTELEILHKHEEMQHSLEHWLPGVVAVRAESRDEGHHHVYLQLDREEDGRAVACVQACLGSDPHRELHNIIRCQTESRIFPLWNEFWNDGPRSPYKFNEKLTVLLAATYAVPVLREIKE